MKKYQCIIDKNHSIGYSEKYDSFYCIDCNWWIESKCSDKKCRYCKDRPPKPKEEKMDRRVCSKCVNFIFSDESQTKIVCDFDYFEETNIIKAMLFVPEMFDCVDDYETLEE